MIVWNLRFYICLVGCCYSLAANAAVDKKSAAPKSKNDVTLGKELYHKHLCVTCHGEDLRGGIGNPLVGEKAENFLTETYIERFVGKVYEHKGNMAELAKVQEEFNKGEWKSRKKPLTMVGTMGATLAATTLSKEDIAAIAQYIVSERSKTKGK